MVKRIELHGVLAQKKGMYALVDDCDYDELNQYHWNVDANGYAVRHVGLNEKAGTPETRNARMHRQIMGWPDSNLVVDHINGLHLDNRRSNLRVVDISFNQYNCKPRTSRKFKGVYPTANGERWVARIRTSEDYLYLGTFDTELEAALCYDQHLRSLCGDDVRLNFPSKSQAALPLLVSLITGQKIKPSTIPFPSDNPRPAFMEIPLGGKHAQGCMALVSTEDYNRLSQYNWFITPQGYVRAKVNGVPVLMHHMVLRPPEGLLIDHINRIKHDNRRENLRVATRVNNQHNRVSIGGKSSYKGVFKNPETGLWCAKITANKKAIYLGSYVTQREAAEVYNQAAIQYHGEFAVLNDLSTPLENDEPIKPSSELTRNRKQSQYRGVHPNNGKWRAVIRKNKKRIHLGYFSDEAEAARAYDKKAVELYGVGAQLNFPNSD